MANTNIANRLLQLDTVGEVLPIRGGIRVQKVVYFPAAVDDDAVIQEYSTAGAAQSAIVIKANHTDVNPVTLDFGWKGRPMNGLLLGTIDGGRIDVYLV